MPINLRQLEALDAVVRQGSFLAAARALHRSHPSLINQLRKLEQQLDVVLFDRSGYRTTLTEAGAAFYRASQRLLREQQDLNELAAYLRDGSETRLRIVIGDVTPLRPCLRLLRAFARRHPRVQLDLAFENLAGPRERLLDGEADLIVHHVDPADPRFERHVIARVEIIPVAAPDFLRPETLDDLSYETLGDYTQCIIRDTAHDSPDENYFVLDYAPRITVGDQQTKKAVIVEGMAWGHMPDFLVARELEAGTLRSLAGGRIGGAGIDIAVARLSAGRKGIMAQKLWRHLTSPTAE